MKIWRGLAVGALSLIVLFIGAIVFWIFGGVSWLETAVFPPIRPSNMPDNSVWIEGAGLPISWHHGSFLGCANDGSQETTTCVIMSHTALLNGGDGLYHLDYQGPYLSCRSGKAVSESDLTLKAVADDPRMWIERPGKPYPSPAAPIVTLVNGDVLLPSDSMAKCPEALERARGLSSPSSK
jgi:hypothetical protein